jgi:hypothetical protein
MYTCVWHYIVHMLTCVHNVPYKCVYMHVIYIHTYQNYTCYGQHVDNYGQVVIVHIHTNVYNICECTYISYTRYMDNIWHIFTSMYKL